MRDFPAAEVRRRALERLENLTDRIVSSGAQGQTREFDAKGREKIAPRGKANTTELVGLKKHEDALWKQAGFETFGKQPLHADPKARRRQLLQRAKERGLLND